MKHAINIDFSSACKGMLRRPQPSDCEADLLREQESFLASGAPSAASVLRRPDKRRGQGGEAEGDGSQENGGTQKDVVTIEGWKEACDASRRSLFLEENVVYC